MRSIVYNDISKSPFCYQVGELIFYFSSEFNKRRFINGYEEYIVDETHKLESKYHVQLDLELELTVAFYKRIEKRGYKVITENNSTINL